jgi:O-antigen ligase
LNILKQYINQVVLFAWTILCFSFTLSPGLLSISFALICSVSLIFIGSTQLNKIEKLIFLCFIAFYITAVYSLFYTNNIEHGVQKLVLKLPILFFPLYFIAIKSIRAKTVIYMVLIFLYAMYLPGVVSVYNYFINKELFDQLILESKPLPIEFGYGIYHIQFSILIAASCLLGLFILLKWRLFELTQIEKLACIVLVLVNFICAHILGARTGLLSLYLGISFLALLEFRTLSKKVKIMAVIGALLIPVLVYTLSSSLRNRIQNTLVDLEVAWEGKDANDYSFALRIQAWKNASDVISKHPIWGVGIGDADSVLFNNFNSVNSKIKTENRKNPHFQFLESSVQSGLISGVLYLLIILFAMYYAFKSSSILGAIALLLFIASCFESILERQASVLGFTVLIAIAITLSQRVQEKTILK